MMFETWPWQQWAKKKADAHAIILDSENISWQQLIADINQQSACLYQQGVREAQSVALIGKNSYQLLIRYLAVLQLGARVLPLNPQFPQTLFSRLFATLHVDGVWLDPAIDIPESFSGMNVFVERSTEITQQDEIRYSSNWLAERPATMTLTSGSSGLPKAAVHSVQAHLENADGLLQKMQFEQDDSWLFSLPLFHVSGQGIIWRWLLKGATLVLRNMKDLPAALKGCTHASLVPTQLWRLLSSADSTLSLKQVLLGGAMIPVELTQQAEAQGIHCWCGYGMTEMASTVCAKRADDLPGVGIPLSNRQMKLVNDEIYLKGAGLALGYWKDNQIMPLVDEAGWFHTRDKGIWQNDELRIIGRLDNQFFSGGEGIQPEDIERLLVAHPAIEQAFIIPIDDAEFGQRPVAIIESTVALDLQEIVSWLDDKIARFQLPVAYYPLPKSLVNGGIKISRKALYNWVKEQNKN